MTHDRKKANHLTHIGGGTAILILFLLQYSFRIIPKIHGATALLLLPIVIAAGARFGEWTGFIYGIAVGFLLDSVTADSVCFCTIVLALIGFFSGFLVSRFFNLNILSVIILGILGCIAFFILKWLVFLVYGYGGILDYLWHHTLPSAIYSAVFTLPFYYLFKWLSGDFVSKSL